MFSLYENEIICSNLLICLYKKRKKKSFSFQYIAELTLLDPECLQSLSSLQAAAILCLALHMCHKPPWVNRFYFSINISLVVLF